MTLRRKECLDDSNSGGSGSGRLSQPLDPHEPPFGRGDARLDALLAPQQRGLQQIDELVVALGFELLGGCLALAIAPGRPCASKSSINLRATSGSSGSRCNTVDPNGLIVCTQLGSSRSSVSRREKHPIRTSRWPSRSPRYTEGRTNFAETSVVPPPTARHRDHRPRRAAVGGDPRRGHARSRRSGWPGGQCKSGGGAGIAICDSAQSEQRQRIARVIEP
jgi:hypothetical protein